jgi:hypothetical protein
MKSIDIKSLLIGILGTLLFIACTAASVKFNPKEGVPGKYAISCVGSGGNTCVVLDTQRGLIVGKVNIRGIPKNDSLLVN